MDNTYRVVFYNVENFFDTIDNPNKDDESFLPDAESNWDSEKYETKIDHLAEVILSMKDENGALPVIIGLSEVENGNVVADLVGHDSLVEAGYAFVHHDSPDERGSDVALVYRQDYFTLTGEAPLQVYPGGDDRTRDILHVKGTLGNRELHFFVNHWPSRREGQQESEPKRIAAAKVLRLAVDEVFESSEDSYIIIMGDFNDEPDNRSITEVLAAGIPGQDEESDLLNLAYKAFLRGEGSYYYHYGKDWNMLDQFIVSRNLVEDTASLNCPAKGMAIHKKDFLTYRTSKKVNIPNRTLGGSRYYGGYSDHFPVYIDLKDQGK